MEINTPHDPRPRERFQWIERYRKIKPIHLQPPHDTAPVQPRSGGAAITGLEPYTGPWEDTQVRHLLSRTRFGVKKSELKQFRDLGLDESVYTLLAESPLPEPPVNNYEGIDENAADPHVGLGESWLDAPHGGDAEPLRIISLKTWLINNFLSASPGIREKMVLFWSNLLVTKVWDVFIAKASYRYFEMFYKMGLGNYRALIRALTVDPSMLLFLNGAWNTKEAPDENYARELQELFCIGKGPDAKFTEEDVQAAARVLTGWTITWWGYDNTGPFTSYFNPNNHDNSDKQFSEFYGNRRIEGRSGSKGSEELDEMLDMIFEQSETARYICRRIYAFFVSNRITEEVEMQIIRPLADIFRQNDYEIRPVLETLLKSNHFYDVQNQGALIKSPADHLLGVWRTLGVDPGTEDPVRKHVVQRSMLWHMANQGMEMGDPPNVAGWAPYYQAPQYDKAWITTDTITKRAITTDSLLYWGFWIAPEWTVNADVLAFVAGLDHPEDPGALLREASMLLTGLQLSDEQVNQLKSILLSGQLEDYYWTSAWYDYQQQPNDNGKMLIVKNRLLWAFQQMLQLGEYHLM